MAKILEGTVHSGRIDRLRLRHLKLLDWVEKLGSLTAAAQEMKISQSSATKLLQDLEEAFGRVLVDRTTRGGVLSLAGERALERMRIATAEIDALGEAMASSVDMPVVRIGMLPFAGVVLVPELVAALSKAKQLPRLQLIDGYVSEILSWLREGRIDCVIGRMDADNPADHHGVFDILPLNDEPFEVACGDQHPLTRRKKLDLADLSDHPWIVPKTGTYTRQVFDAAFARLGIPAPTPQIESGSFHVSLATVAASDLLTMAPRSAVDFYCDQGHVKKIKLVRPFDTDYSVLVTRRSDVSLPAVELIKKTLQQIAAAGAARRRPMA